MNRKRGRMPRPAPVKELMNSLFAGTPVENRLQEGKIWVAWDAAVGPQIAAQAQPVSFRDGILTIRVASGPWMQQLTFLKKPMVEKLNSAIGRELVTDIHLKAGSPRPAEKKTVKEQKPKRLLSEQEKLRIAEQSAAIADPDLRAAVASLLSTHLMES